MPPASPPATPPSSSGPARSRFLTAAAWTLLVAGGLLTPISALSLLMLVAGSHGTGSATLGGFLSVVVAPPAAVLAGLGLWRRQRWAWPLALALLGGVVLLNLHTLLTARATTTVTTSPTGVKTTVLASGPNYHSLPLIALALFGLVKLASRPIRAELGVGARTVARVPPALPPVAVAPPSYHTVAPELRPAHGSSTGSHATPRQRQAAWFALALLVVIAAGLVWAVCHGLDRGSTFLPLHRASFQRPIVRDAEPAFFWFAIGLYAFLALAAAGSAAWLARETLRLKVTRDAAGR